MDDEPDLIDLLKSAFADQGFEVLTASSGESACRILDTQKVDIVLTDVRMPDGDGFDILDFAKRRGLSPDFYVMTAYNDINGMSQNYLVRQIFKKPFSVSEMVRRIDSN